ncbi:MAG: methyltransferase, partial [Rikenellaceae bacterium]
MSSDIFRFKNFSVRQSSSAMKVGTDGVLLGAWATSQCSDSAKNILDIGTGTGVIALMAAEVCSSAKITAVEIEREAAEEARYNFEASRWSDRLTIHNQSFQEFCAQKEHHHFFDIVVTNPPYFINSLKNETASKTAARHALLLPYEDLADGVEKIVSEDGYFFAILPYAGASIFIALAALKGLYLRKRVDVQ